MKTGVYKILNILTGQHYIGSASASFNKRWICHLSELRNGNHGNVKLQRSFDKYGESSFVFSVLAYCPPLFCLPIEQWYIDKTEPYYNICTKAGTREGVKHTQKTITKLRNKATGKIYSEETRAKVSKSLIGNKRNFGIQHTDEAKRKMSEARKGKKCPNRKSPSEESRAIRSERGKLKPLPELMRQRSREALLGKKHSDERVEQSRASHSKFKYQIKTPSGEIKETTSLVLFARENGMGAANNALANTLRGYNHKGWKTEYFKGYKVISKEQLVKQ